jgi:hypothetical protein
VIDAPSQTEALPAATSRSEAAPDEASQSQAVPDKAEAAGPPPGLNVLFVHIPKTAGMSLYTALQAWATPSRSVRFARGGKDDQASLLSLSDDEIDHLRLISGHLSWRGFRERLGPDWTAITVLRDPVERALSLVSFVRGEPDHPWHARSKRMGVGKFLAWYRNEPFSVNQMCKFISSTADPDVAYRALEQDFALACTVEHLAAFTERLGELLGHPVVLPHENASRGRRLDRTKIDKAIVAAIEAADGADRILYDRVRGSGLVGRLARAPVPVSCRSA